MGGLCFLGGVLYLIIGQMMLQLVKGFHFYDKMVNKVIKRPLKKTISGVCQYECGNISSLNVVLWS